MDEHLAFVLQTKHLVFALKIGKIRGQRYKNGLNIKGHKSD